MLTMLLALSSPAHALSCLWGVMDVNVQENDVVPTDLQVLIRHTYDAGAELEVVLLDAAGDEVPSTVEVFDRYATLVPDEPLTPGAAYSIVDRGVEGYADIPFTAGEGPSTGTPAVPVILDVQRERDRSEWGTTEGLQVELQPPSAGVYTELQLSLDADFTAPLTSIAAYEHVHLGHGLCGSSIPDYDHGERYHVRARSIDQAGNLSDWTTFGSSPVGGCSTTGSGALGGLFVLPLLAIFRRR